MLLGNFIYFFACSYFFLFIRLSYALFAYLSATLFVIALLLWTGCPCSSKKNRLNVILLVGYHGWLEIDFCTFHPTYCNSSPYFANKCHKVQHIFFRVLDSDPGVLFGSGFDSSDSDSESLYHRTFLSAFIDQNFDKVMITQMYMIVYIGLFIILPLNVNRKENRFFED